MYVRLSAACRADGAALGRLDRQWGVVLDAGLATKAFTPKSVLLTHGHRDHAQALPVLARAPFFGRAPAAAATDK